MHLTILPCQTLKHVQSSYGDFSGPLLFHLSRVEVGPHLNTSPFLLMCFTMYNKDLWGK